MSDQTAPTPADAAGPTPEQKRYSRRRYALFGINLIVGIAYLAAMIACGSSVISRWAEEITRNTDSLGAAFVYFAFFSLIYLIITLPITFYSEYILEHQFGLSTQTLGRWAGRRIKKWIISFVVAAPLIVGFYWILHRWPAAWWIPSAVAWLVISYVFARFAPKILIPLFYKLTPITDDALVRRLTELAARARLTLTGVFRLDLSRETKKANAAVVGLGSQRRVVLGDTLLDSFTRDEIAVVFAHELGHIVRADIVKQFILGSVLTIGSLYVASLILAGAADSLGFRVYDPRTLPILLVIFGVIQLGVMPFEKWFSRWCEIKADEYALRTTRDRDAFITSMQKLGTMNLADVNPNRIAELFLFSHPPISKRIRFAQNLDLRTAE